MKKVIILISVALITIVVSALITRLIITEVFKADKTFLEIVEPKTATTVKQGESFIVKGRSSPYKNLLFILKNSSGEKIPEWPLLELKVVNENGEFEQELTIDNYVPPGNYVLNVNLDKKSENIFITVAAGVMPPGSAP